MAEEMRTRGDMMRHEETRQQYFRLAESYERLAASEQLLALDGRIKLS